MTAAASGTTTPAAAAGAETGTPAAGTEQQGGEQQQYTPPATQADLDRIVSERLNRQKAQFKDYDELKAAKAELDTIKAANQTEAEKQAAELTKWQTEAESWRKTAVGSRVQALAAAEFADPSDAVTALADNNYLDAGGQIDDAAIARDLAEVLEKKPHWRRAEGGAAGPRLPAPNHAQGSSGGPPAANPAAQLAAIIQGQLGS